MACCVVVYFLYSLPNIVLQNRIATCVLSLGTKPNLVRKLSASAGVISPLCVMSLLAALGLRSVVHTRSAVFGV